MAKPKKRKSAGKAEKASAEPKNDSTHVDPTPSVDVAAPQNPDEAASPFHLPNAATLLDEVQQRCASLRDWQQSAQASLQERARVVDRREKGLDETQKEVELGRSRLELDQDALKRARLMFDKERNQLDQSQQALESEQARLDRARCDLSDQKQELQGLRDEMDAEWASLARIRRAQETLAAAMESERARVQDLKITDSQGDPDTESDDSTADGPPGLSLTQAA